MARVQTEGCECQDREAEDNQTAPSPMLAEVLRSDSLPRVRTRVQVPVTRSPADVIQEFGAAAASVVNDLKVGVLAAPASFLSGLVGLMTITAFS